MREDLDAAITEPSEAQVIIEPVQPPASESVAGEPSTELNSHELLPKEKE